MLQDLVVHPAGLRLRDRVSHGEVCTYVGMIALYGQSTHCVSMVLTCYAVEPPQHKPIDNVNISW